MVTFEVNGKTHSLRYDINALCALEDHFGGLPIQDILRFRMGVKTVRGLVWAGLIHEDDSLTPTTAGLMLQQYIDKNGSHVPLTTAILKALTESGVLATEKKAEAKKDEEKKEAAGGNDGAGAAQSS